MNVINEDFKVEKKYVISSEKHPDARWYVVQTQSNTEKKATNNLMEEIKLRNLEDKILEVFNPTIEVVELKVGKKRKVSKRPFSGYIFIFAIMDDVVCNAVQNTDRIVSFPSKGASRTLPLRMSVKDIQAVFDAVDIEKIKDVDKFKFAEGVMVTIINPEIAFHGMVGKIIECDADKNKAKLEVSIFGRGTEIEVPMDSIEIYELKEES